MKKYILNLALAGTVALTSTVAAANHDTYINAPPELCTGARVITEDGYTGTVVALYFGRPQVEVQLDGVHGTDTFSVNEIALTNICVQRGALCVGDEVIVDGYRARIAGLFANRSQAIVKFVNSRWTDLVHFSDLALTNACERLRTCRAKRNIFKNRY